MLLRNKLLAGSFAASVVINLIVVSALGWSRLSATTPSVKRATPKKAAEKRFVVYTPPKPKPAAKPKSAVVKPKSVVKPPVPRPNAPKPVVPKPAVPKPRIKPTPPRPSKPKPVTPPKPPGKAAAFKSAKPKPKTAPKPPGKPNVKPPVKPKPPGASKPLPKPPGVKPATPKPQTPGARPPSPPKPPGRNLTGQKTPRQTPPGKPKPPGGKPKTGQEGQKPARPGKPANGQSGAGRNQTPGLTEKKHYHAPVATPKARVLPKMKLGPKGPGRAKSAAAVKAIDAKKAVVGRKAITAKKAVGAQKAVKSTKVVTKPQASNILPGARFKNGTIALPPSAGKSANVTSSKPTQTPKPGKAATPGRTGQTARVAQGATTGRTGRAAVGDGTGNEEIGGGDGNGLVGTYYEGANFERFRARRADARVEFDWWSKLPVPQMPPATPYSVRWTGLVQPRFTEVYTFSTIADDGVRLWVNGQKIIDDWQIQPATEVKGVVALVAGQKYDIRLEFFEKNGTSISKVFLYWTSRSQAHEIIPESRLYQGRF